MVVQFALGQADRRPETFAVTRDLTAAEQPTAEDWALGGDAALTAGDAADALAYFRRAQALDVEVASPYYRSWVVRQFRADGS